MQGHPDPESPRLWEKHMDTILHSIGFEPTKHQPCLYSGLIDGERVLFKRQVDDFAVAARCQRTANIVFDLLDERLIFPLMGLIQLFNGMDIQQTRYWIKISCSTYIGHIMPKHEATLLKEEGRRPRHPTPLPATPQFMDSFMMAKGSTDKTAQAKLAKEQGLGYRNDIGELIYVMITCCPDLSYAVTAAAQHSAAPHELHYHGLKHALLSTEVPPAHKGRRDLLLAGGAEYEPS